MNLNTPDVGIANKIAKAIRFSSGGLRYVKSMGVELKARNLAQVSINLTDFEQTPMHRVYEMVKREAARYGAIPVGSEIVGLIPKKADRDGRGLFLAGGEFFAGADLREQAGGGADRRVRGAGPKDGKLGGIGTAFSGRSCGASATPGGGSVSALAGALAGRVGADGRGTCLARRKSQLAVVDKLSEALERCGGRRTN